MEDTTLYILDSYGLIYRAYYAFINRPLVNPDGVNVSAVFGFFRIFHSILKHYAPRHIVAAFDSRKPTFRHEMYDQYKANRQKTPEDLHAQVPVIEEILTVLGVPILRKDGYEADDVIATMAGVCKKRGFGCKILSGDKDLMQLVEGSITIMKPDKNGGWEEVGEDGVYGEWGVYPSQMLDMLSLTGDKSDNIPGVAGIGDKTAQKLLAEYKDMDGIYAHIDDITGATGRKLADGKDMAYFSRQLVTLFSDVPVDTAIEHFTIDSPDYDAAARLLFRVGVPAIAKMYSSSIINQKPASTEKKAGKQAAAKREDTSPGLFDEPAQEEDAIGANGTDAGVTASPDGENQVIERFLKKDAAPAPVKKDEKPKPAENIDLIQNTGDYRAVTSLKELNGLIDAILKQGIAAYDSETTSLDAHNALMAGFSFSLKKGEGFYIPLMAPDAGPGGLIARADAMASLSRLFGTPGVTIIMHNGKFDYEVLRAAGVEHIRCGIVDTMIAAWLLNPERSSLGLEALAESKLHLKTISYTDIVPKGSSFCDVPLEKAVPYGCEDADLTWQLWQEYEPQMKEMGLTELFSGLEMPLIPILAEMERAGIKIEKQKLAEYGVELGKKIETAQRDIYELVGHEFNISSTKQLQEVLFNERKLPTSRKIKTGYSTDTSVLEELASQDPVPAKILEYRGLTKLLSTYVDALPQLADADGRIHTSFVQTGTATGRLSSRDPNLQNIPIRDEDGRRIRQAFIARGGCKLISADYSQIELVILAHLSADANLMDAFVQGSDVHKRTASLIFGVPEADVSPEMRRTAKTINFGVMYGMSAFRLANELGIPRTQAGEFITSYFQTYSGVKALIDKTIADAEKTGYVETIMGRRRYIPTITSRNKTEKAAAERMAVNTPIQGSAADIVKKAMIAVSNALKAGNLKSRLLLQVHDELIVEAPDDEVETMKELLRKEMEGVAQLRIPLRVSVEAGSNWGEFH